MITPEDVLEFWFGDEPTCLDDVKAIGMRLGPSLDAEVRDRFGALIETAFAGGLAEWEQSHGGTLALIIVLDQLPRHAFRGTARQYAGDARAFELARVAHDDGWVDALPPLQRTFAQMPFGHSESLETHRGNVARADDISAGYPKWYGPFAQIGPSQSRKYLKIIEQFGRFPHRNAMLGRSNTPEEQTWLDEGNAERMGPDLLRK